MTQATLPRRARRTLKRLAYSGLRRDRWQRPDRVIAALDIREGNRVADLGAGGGYFTFRLAEAVGEEGAVYAVDADEDMTSLIGERASRERRRNVVAVTADPDDPMLPERVDVILIVDAYHHLPASPAYLRTLARHLRPGGRVAVVEARPRWFRFGHATDPADIRSAMAAAGYDLVDEHGFLPRQGFLTFTPNRVSS